MQCASDGADLLEIDEASDIVDEIGHADLHLGALDADGAHEQLHSGFLISKDVLDGNRPVVTACRPSS